MRKRLCEDAILFLSGGLCYGLIEVLWRKYTHWTMIITGGVCFLSLYRLFSRLPKLTLPERCVIGSTIITLIEFFCGCIVNLWLKMKVWDYSAMPLNLIGQICLLYSTLWGFLCIPISSLCKKIETLRLRATARQAQK